MDTKKLRQKILDLAIRGKLVPQAPNDEPASVLLERIRAEKERLIKEGKIKRGKKSEADTPNDENEFPFEIPECWEWVRLGALCNVVRGGSPRPAGSKEFYEGPIPFLKVADLTRDDCIYVNKAQSSIKEAGLTKTRLIKANTLLLTNSGATLGVPKINTFETAINDGIAAFLYLSSDIQMFIYWYLKSKTNSFRQIDQGAAQPNLNTDILSAENIPLPPLSEQHRIVAAVEQWFALIDILENAKDDLQTSIAKAKSKILDLAIHGKLVPQDPNDEPASVQLERIHAEKERLIKEGKIKRGKKSAFTSNTSLSENDILFDIPESWEWCKLIDVCHICGRIGFRGYTKDDLVENGAITLSPSNIIDGKMDYNYCTYISWEKYEESPEIQINNGDILVVKTGSSFGKCAFVDDLPQKATINPQFVVLKHILCHAMFLTHILQSGYARHNYDEFVLGTAIPTFTQVVLGDMLIPLPPYSEQLRIVAKIEELFAVLDKIKESIEA